MVTPDPQDRSSQDKHIELVNIIGNPGAGMLTRAMTKQLSVASSDVRLFVDFHSEEEPKKVSEALKHPGWVDAMQDELNQFGKNKVPIFYDNTSAIAISNNLVLHSRIKHIDIRYHFIRDHVLKGDIELHFILTQYQLADIFTKPLDEPTFKRLIVELVMLNIESKPEASALPEEN
ncbi:hypothetical protein Tco_1539626 [Tanacetum coccineum]